MLWIAVVCGQGLTPACLWSGLGVLLAKIPVFLFSFLFMSSICTEVMGVMAFEPGPWNMNSKFLDEIVRKFQITKILDKIAKLWMMLKLGAALQHFRHFGTS